MNEPAKAGKSNKEGGSSLILRFATSTGLLAVAVVLLAVIFFQAIRGDIFQAAFQSPLKEWSATVAGHIGRDVSRARAVAKTHKIGIILSNADGRFAFGPDGEPADPDELLKDTSRFRQIDVHIQHGGQAQPLHYSFMLDKEQFDNEHRPLLIGLIVLLLITIGLAYAIQLRLLRPLKWLRTPLARIKVALELLPEGDKRDAIAQDIREMESLTTVLLEREQVRTQANQSASGRVNLVALAGNVIDGFSNTPPGVELNVPPQSLEINGDEALVKVLIQNLVDNALKFSLPDSKPVKVSLRQTDDEVQIIVDDDGQGIPEDQVEKIFEPFVKLNPARGHRAGYGLGLNLCQRIVQAQGGNIEINPKEKRGTRICVSLPK